MGLCGEEVCQSFRNSFRGQKAVSIHIALGSLIIQERLQLSDRDTVEQIAENRICSISLVFPGSNSTRPPIPRLLRHFRNLLRKLWIEVNRSSQS
uniref:transposase n=1 Tax=Paenibacillus plantarum TaxID=2654975 RepID=UPI0035E3F593